MFWALLLLNVGCTVRVASEVLAYKQLMARAWQLLPASAIVELAAVTMFAANLALTFAGRRAAAGPTGTRSVPLHDRAS